MVRLRMTFSLSNQHLPAHLENKCNSQSLLFSRGLPATTLHQCHRPVSSNPLTLMSLNCNPSDNHPSTRMTSESHSPSIRHTSTWMKRKSPHHLSDLGVATPMIRQCHRHLCNVKTGTQPSTPTVHQHHRLLSGPRHPTATAYHHHPQLLGPGPHT